MSKLYKKYMLLKINNPNKFYIFECGIFYIFIADDAIFMSKKLNLKLTHLNSIIVKCGFPIKSADKYFNILKTLNYDIDIINISETLSCNMNNHIINEECYNLIKEFLTVDIDSLSISKAFDLLCDLQIRFKKLFNKGVTANEKKK